MKTFLALCVASFALTVTLFAQLPAAVSPSWTEVAPGVWKTTVGHAESFTLLSAAGVPAPARTALAALPKVAFPLDEKQIEGRQWDWKTAVRFPLALDEDSYGLGVDFMTAP